MTRDELERAYDGPIDARELDAARYPTREARIEQANAEIQSANRLIRQTMANWICERAGFLQQTADPAEKAIATAIYNREFWNINRHHLRVFRRHRLYAQRDLKEMGD